MDVASLLNESVRPEHLRQVKEVIKARTAEPGTPVGIDASGRRTTLSAEEGAALIAEAETIRSRLDLHTWLFGHAGLRRAFCKFPGCFREPRDRNGAVGSHPVYCEDAPDPDGPLHSSDSSFTARRDLKELRAKRSGDTSTEVTVVPGVALSDQHPVSRRLTETLPAQFTHLDTMFRTLIAEMQDLRASIEVASDPEAVLLEIDGAQSRFRQIIETQEQETITARNDALAAKRASTQKDELIEEANSVAEQALASAAAADLRANAAEQAVAAVTTEIDKVRAEAQAAVTQAHADAQETLRREREEMAQTLAEQQQAMRDAVARADDAAREAHAAAQAQQDAARVAVATAEAAQAAAEDRAGQEFQRAQQLDTDLRDLRQRHTADVDRLNSEIGTLRTAADDLRAKHDKALTDRDEAHSGVLRELRQQHTADLDRLNGEVSALRKAAEDLHVEHSKALTDRDEAHRLQLREELRTQRDTLTAAHAELISELRATIAEQKTGLIAANEQLALERQQRDEAATVHRQKPTGQPPDEPWRGR